MANKLAVVTDTADPALWILARGIQELVKRHPKSFDMDHIGKIQLADVADGEIVYVLGHGAGGDIRGLDGTAIGEMLLKQGLPKDKKVRIRLLTCETALYANVEQKLAKEKMDDLRFGLGRDLKGALKQARVNDFTIEIPLGNVFMGSITDKIPDQVVKPEHSVTVMRSFRHLTLSILDPRRLRPEIEAVNNGVFGVLRNPSQPLLKVVPLVNKPAILGFVRLWGDYLKGLSYEKLDGWQIIKG